jgi:hypothetical protein
MSPSKFDNGNKGNYEINQLLKSGKRFVVQDSTQYSPTFISELRVLVDAYNSILSMRVSGTQIIINESDSSTIPTQLPVNKEVVFEAQVENKRFRLLLNRINITNINYQFYIDDSLNRNGQVILSPLFSCLTEKTTKIKDMSAIKMSQYFEYKECTVDILVELINSKRAAYHIRCNKDLIKDFQSMPILEKK